MGDNKRPRSEDETKMNDSLQSLLSELQSKTEPTTKDLAEFISEYIALSEEMRNSMLQMKFTTNMLSDQLKKVEEESKTTVEKVETNTMCLEIIKHDIQKYKESSISNETSLHKLEQQSLDKDIFLSGFPKMPNADETVESLCGIFNISNEMIESKYAYKNEINIRNGKPTSTPKTTSKNKIFYHMVIKFKTSISKFNFLQAKKINGPLKFEQLCNDSAVSNEMKNTTINISHRLSRFNLEIRKKLFQLKNDGKIHSFQLHNGIFRMREKETSSWMVVGSTEILPSPMNTSIDIDPQTT